MMPSTFPSLPEIAALTASEYERGFIELEFRPGLAYYLARLDRLGFAGEAVLDAGCGCGQWSIALAQRFARVEALDLKPERLAVLEGVARGMGVANVAARVGSIESLPLPEASVDAVFCYGVIMFTDVRKVLGEFCRVLRPGGRVYVCLNGDGWSRYLVEERSLREPAVRRAGESTLYSTYWARALEKGLVATLRAGLDIWVGSPPWTLYRFLCKAAARFRLRAVRRSIARLLLSFTPAGRELLDEVAKRCGPELEATLLDDAFAILEGRDAPPSCGVTRAYLPRELEARAAAAGFVDFQWSIEAGLVCDWLAPAVEPRFPGYFAGDLSVWECLLAKPDRVARPSVERHLCEAREAREARLYFEPAAAPVVSNRSLEAYPSHLVEHAVWLAARMGGAAYLAELARLVVGEATDEEDVVRRLLVFVQRAIYRDPISQPFLGTGGLPDALAILICARGRCGHASALLAELCRQAGLEARTKQLPNHVVVEVKAGDRWVLADADAFKNGVIPTGREGRLLTLDELRADPYQLDRFPATGWFERPGSRFARGAFGSSVRGYVDALEPERRGFVSGYYVAAAAGAPPSLAEVRQFERRGARFLLDWAPSRLASGRLLGYRVAVSAKSRGWSYESPGEMDEILRPPGRDVLDLETEATRVEADIPLGVCFLFASITAFSDRIEKERETFFWPSEEARLELP